MKKSYVVYLLYLLMVTVVVAAVSLSKFSTTGEGTDTVSVAKPVLSYLPQSAELNGTEILEIGSGLHVGDLLPGDILVYHFDIVNFENSNLNQVLLKYRVTVEWNPVLPNLPFSYTLEPAATYDSAGDGYVYLGFGGQITHSYTLTITWDETDAGSAYLDKQQTLQIKIEAEQVDSLT
ncbi:MAG: hypothetical protein LLG09_01850 [Negativicutes bacterium]|nr:hypothetical protein [Negativicutes bacterium]